MCTWYLTESFPQDLKVQWQFLMKGNVKKKSFFLRIEGGRRCQVQGLAVFSEWNTHFKSIWVVFHMCGVLY